MTNEQVRQIIREEFSNILGIDRYIFDKNIQILNGHNIQLGRGIGTKIGTASDQLLAFYGVAPVDQPNTIADPAGGATIDGPARTAINALIDRLQELGLIQ